MSRVTLDSFRNPEKRGFSRNPASFGSSSSLATRSGIVRPEEPPIPMAARLWEVERIQGGGMIRLRVWAGGEEGRGLSVDWPRRFPDAVLSIPQGLSQMSGA